jgi:hypothetical protein
MSQSPFGLWSMRVANHRVCLLALLAALPMLCAIGGPAAAAEIDIIGAIAGSGGTRSLTFVIERDTLDWPVVIRRNDSSDAPVPVRIDITPLIGPSAQLVEQQRLLLNGRPVDQEATNLASLAQAELRLAGLLPIEGDFIGQLGVIVEGKRVPYDLKVTRRKPANPPKVGFVGATTDGKLAMTSDRADFKWPLTLRRDDSLKDDVEIILHVPQMSGPSGTIIEPILNKGDNRLTEPVKLKSFAEQSLTLTGRAELEGTYTGEISYELNGVRFPVTLTLTRSRPDFDLKIEAISKIRATAGDAGAKLRVHLLNPVSAAREIYLPDIAKLDRVDASGATPVDVGTSGYKLEVTPDGSGTPRTLRVDKDAGRDLEVTIKGLTAPGSYKGVMRFTAPDRKAVDAPFELALRLCWLWAAAAITLGVLVSAGLRYFQQTGQPRLILQRDALGLRAKLTTLFQAESSHLDVRERQVITLLIGQLDEASDDLADTSTAIEDASALISSVRARLPLLTPWISARRRRDALRPPSLGDDVEPDITTVFNTLMNNAAASADIASAQGLLNGIDAKIKAATIRYLNKAIQDLQQAIAGFGTDAVKFDLVLGELDTAGRETTASRFDLAGTALDRARAKFAEIAAGLLRTRLTETTSAIGFTADEWKSFAADIGGLLDLVATEPDPERRVQRWTEANRRYLIEIIRRAKARIDYLIEANIQDTKDALTKAQAKLIDAQNQLAAGNLGAAQQAYAAAIDLAGQTAAALQAVGQKLGKDANAGGSAPGAGADVPSQIIVTAVASLMPLPLGRDVTLKQVTRSLLNYSLVFAVVMLVIAVLSGLQLLYVPNPAFSWGDMILAFLWGAGLHAVAGQTFQGVAGLARQLS